MSKAYVHTPPWSMCVLDIRRKDYSNLKNALLYADVVHWVSMELIQELLTRVHETPRQDIDVPPATSCEAIVVLPQIMREVDAAGAQGLIVPFVDVQALRRESVVGGLALMMEGVVSAMVQSKVWTGLSPNDKPSPRWNAYEAAGELQAAVSGLLLPDISSLPVEVILEMRAQLTDILDPMRAELLRFTEDLRVLVGRPEVAPGVLRNEAHNLVATRVEPVVREAASLVRTAVDKKWRKLFKGLARAFGLATASYIDPRLIGKAVAETVETAVAAAEKVEDKRPNPKMTAQFVLEAHTFLAERQG